LLGLCAEYIQGGLTKLFDFNAAVAETQSFGLPFAAAATAATIVAGVLFHAYYADADAAARISDLIVFALSKRRALPAIHLGSPGFIIHVSLARQCRASGL
jgi:hypothetical protein